MTATPARSQPVSGEEGEAPYHIGYVLLNSLEYADALPKTLWHYTNGSGLTGIITGRNLWGTHHLYLNDLSEFTYAATVINAVLDEVIDDSTTAGVRDELHRLQSLVADPNSVVIPQIFICSFSARHDHLTLWRSYTRAGDAYSVGIDGMYLWMRGMQSWQLRRCFYDRMEQRLLIHQAIKGRLEDIQRGIEVRRAFVELAYDFGWLAPFLKDPRWEDEHEWRFIRYPRELVRFPEPDPPGYHTRVGPRGAVPYLPFALDGDPLSVRVTIGPGPTPALTEDDIVAMGAKTSILATVDHSRRPIRYW